MDDEHRLTGRAAQPLHQVVQVLHVGRHGSDAGQDAADDAGSRIGQRHGHHPQAHHRLDAGHAIGRGDVNGIPCQREAQQHAAAVAQEGRGLAPERAAQVEPQEACDAAQQLCFSA